MSDTGKTKAEMMADAAREKVQSYDEHARALVEKWMAKIREIKGSENEKN
jgi:hypothetical protein